MGGNGAGLIALLGTLIDAGSSFMRKHGAEDSTTQLEVGAKIGFGVGASVKGRVGLVGADSIRNGLKSGTSSVWSGVRSGSQSAWSWIWND